jgi:hypothetical protein
LTGEHAYEAFGVQLESIACVWVFGKALAIVVQWWYTFECAVVSIEFIEKGVELFVEFGRFLRLIPDIAAFDVDGLSRVETEFVGVVKHVLFTPGRLVSKTVSSMPAMLLLGCTKG